MTVESTASRPSLDMDLRYLRTEERGCALLISVRFQLANEDVCDIHIMCTHVHMHAQTQLPVIMCACMRACVHACMCSMCACVCTYMHVRICHSYSMHVFENVIIYVPDILRWPDIIDVDVQRGEAPISHSIIVWTIENYSDYLQRIFTKEDGVTNIDPYQAGFKLTVVSFRPPAVIKLSLPIFFSGRVVLFVSFNRSVSTDDTGFTPVCSESPQVIPSKPCSIGLRLICPPLKITC